MKRFVPAECGGVIWQNFIRLARHTATSLLKNAGVSPAVAMDIIGHDSEPISRHYTHIES